MGIGATKVYPAHGRINYERTPPWELVVDEGACLTSDPRSLYQQKAIPAEVLAARFPQRKHRAAIQAAVGSSTIASTEPAMVTVTDLVPVWEAWHLPSSPTTKDGKHVICLEGHTLLIEPWTLDRFPFAFLKLIPL